jgi:hypothetical protein
MKQLELNLNTLTPDDIRTLLLLGWAEPSGVTPDGKVTEYQFTHAGRVHMARHLNQDDSVPECMK